MIVRILKNTVINPVDKHIDCDEIDIKPTYKNKEEENPQVDRVEIASRKMNGEWNYHEFKGEPLLCIFVMNDKGKTVSRYHISENGRWDA